MEALIMGDERIVKRYSAYYSGWCVAFGEHEIAYDESRSINWLYGESRIGFVLANRLKRILMRELLGKHKDMPEVVLADSYAAINEHTYRFESDEDRRGFGALRKLFLTRGDVHMFLTSHFCYPPGTRIITFSSKKPLIIMYKEIKPLKLVLA